MTNKSASRSSDLESGFHLGSWRVEPRRNAIFRGEEKKHLENRLMQTLIFLAEHPDQTITRQQFFDSVWQGRIVNEEALSRAISLLRTALGDKANAPEYIQTIPGVGYRLVAQIATDENTLQRPQSAPETQKNSIAVLPFVNLSDDPGNEYFSEGISEEILNVLAQVRRFKVVGRTSSFAFKGRNEDLREIGRTLSVSHVLEGSVRKAGERVRVTAQLIKTNDGYHLWSETFDRDLSDIFRVQDEIAAAISKALKVRLLGDIERPQIIGGTINPKAFQAYLKGKHYLNRGALRATVQSAVDAFKLATQLDPKYARAYVGLAFTWNDMVWNAYVSMEEGLRQMNMAAEKAIELEPELADGHLALGLSMQMQFQHRREAFQAIKRAMTLNPGNISVLIEYSRINCNFGNWEISIEAAKKALELDPVSVYANHWLGHVLYFARQFEEAIPALRHALELDPNYPKPHYFISMSYLWMGDAESALMEIEKEPLAWMKLTASTLILHRLGRSGEAQTEFDALVNLGLEDDCSVQQAGIYVQMGESDLAMDMFNRALDLGDPGLTQLLIDPGLDPIRDDKRFIELLEKVGFAIVGQGPHLFI